MSPDILNCIECTVRTWKTSVRLSLSMTTAKSVLLTIANRVASETATRETSIPYRDVGEAWEHTGKVKEAATHLKIWRWWEINWSGKVRSDGRDDMSIELSSILSRGYANCWLWSIFVKGKAGRCGSSSLPPTLLFHASVSVDIEIFVIWNTEIFSF